jgi:hypothetical protein
LETTPLATDSPCLNSTHMQLFVPAIPGSTAAACATPVNASCTIDAGGRILAASAPYVDVLWESVVVGAANASAANASAANASAANASAANASAANASTADASVHTRGPGVAQFVTRLHVPWIQERRPDIFSCEKTAPPWRPLGARLHNALGMAAADSATDDAPTPAEFTESFPRARAHITAAPGLAHTTRFYPDEGVRVRAIVTADTTSVRAMQLLGAAKTRNDVVQACRQFSDACVLQEHATVPLDYGWHAAAWEQAAPRPDCKLWVAELHRTPQCTLALGSWMLACMPVAAESKRMAALFTQTAARWCSTPQPLILVQPGFSWPQLLKQGRTQWTITFVELQRRTAWYNP